MSSWPRECRSCPAAASWADECLVAAKFAILGPRKPTFSTVSYICYKYHTEPFEDLELGESNDSTNNQGLGFRVQQAVESRLLFRLTIHSRTFEAWFGDD